MALAILIPPERQTTTLFNSPVAAAAAGKEAPPSTHHLILSPVGINRDRPHCGFPDDRFARLRCSVERRNAFWTLSARSQCVDVEPDGGVVISRRWRGWRRCRS